MILDFLPISDMPVFYNFFLKPNYRDQVSSVVNLHTVFLCMHSPCWPAGKCRHKIQSLKWCNIHFLWKKRRKILEIILCKTCHIYFWQLLSEKQNEKTRYILLKTGCCSPWDNQKKPTTRANLACFTGDKVSKHNICPQETCETWRWLRRFNGGNSSLLFYRLF